MVDKSQTYEIISKVSYLIGVKKLIFENEHEGPEMKWYNELDNIKGSRVIRSLCEIRTTLLLNYHKIENEMIYNIKNINTLPQYFSTDSINQLYQNGIELIKANYRPNKYIVDINKYILDNIEKVKDLFPLWLRWDYIRDLFIMPCGHKEEKVKQEWSKYINNLPVYPYQAYINWIPEDNGNILYNDLKFCKLLYAQNGAFFNDNSKVLDASQMIKNNIYDFLNNSSGTVIVVDCENSDPYKLCSVLKNLRTDELSKVKKIILFDDYRTSRAWKLIERFTSICIEHEFVERVNNYKSLVDIRMTAGTCKEFYQNNIKSFIIVSSDSDYWGLISALPEANFLMMVEYGKCGSTIKKALDESGIYYCSIDDFCSGNIDDLKTTALLSELKNVVEGSVNFNINDILQDIYTKLRIEMSDTEKRRFYDKYVKTMKLIIENDGLCKIQFKE